MEENTYQKLKRPFEPWMLLSAYTVVKWIHKEE